MKPYIMKGYLSNVASETSLKMPSAADTFLE